MYLNHYNCERCGYCWSDESEYMNNDRCPKCDIEMTPYATEDLPLHTQDFAYYGVRDEDK